MIDELRWTPSVDSSRICVSVSDGAVTLSGEVGSYPEKLDAEQAVEHVRGVRAIAQELRVQSVFDSLTDTHVAQAAGAAVEQAVDVPAGAVVIVVDAHVVTLTGTVPWHHQRQSADRAVRYLHGVEDVRNQITLTPGSPTTSITTEILAALARNAHLRDHTCTVAADADGVVTITGTLPSWSGRREIERVAWAAPGVTDVHNRVRVRS